MRLSRKRLLACGQVPARPDQANTYKTTHQKEKHIILQFGLDCVHKVKCNAMRASKFTESFQFTAHSNDAKLMHLLQKTKCKAIADVNALKTLLK